MSAWFEFAGLSFSVGAETRTVVCSGAVDRGGVMLVRGPSGGGKSTLLRVLARLQPGTGGDVRLGGRQWLAFAPTEWRTAVCYVAQQPALFEGTVLDNLRRPFQLAAVRKRGAYSGALVEKGLVMLGLAPKLLEQDARSLSGGEAARMAVLRAMLTSPPVLLLDEPTAALDRVSAAGFCELIGNWLAAEPDRGAIIITHDELVENFFPDPVLLELGAAGGQARRRGE